MSRTLKVAFLLLFFAPLLGGCWETGNGEKVGTITRLNKRGVFCKTWEGEIIRGGLNTGSGVMGTAFHFTIEDEALAQQVQHYLDTQQEVKIAFRSEGITFCRSDSEDYFLKSIQPLNIVATPPAQTPDLHKPLQASQPGSDSEVARLLRQNNDLLERLLNQK